MGNPLSNAKPAHQLRKATSQGGLGALIYLIKHVWRQNQICLKALWCTFYHPNQSMIK